MSYICSALKSSENTQQEVPVRASAKRVTQREAAGRCWCLSMKVTCPPYSSVIKEQQMESGGVGFVCQ